MSEASVQITVNAVDDVPVAGDDRISTPAGKPVAISVQSNDSPGDGGQHIEFLDNGTPTKDKIPTAGGTAERDGDKVLYTPRKGGSGGIRDSFQYVVIDGDGDVSNPATVTIDVGANVAPEALADTFPVPPSGHRVRANDSDSDNLTFRVIDLPTNGQLTFDQGNGNFTYTPTSGWSGDDFFTFVANDGNHDSNVARVTLRVSPPPPPAASPALLGLGPAAAFAPLARRRRRS
jgi:hypothetical protein